MTLAQFLEINFKRQLGWKFDITGNTLFIVLNFIHAYVFAYGLIFRNIDIPWFCLPYFRFSNSALFFLPNTTVLSFTIDVVLTLSTLHTIPIIILAVDKIPFVCLNVYIFILQGKSHSS